MFFLYSDRSLAKILIVSGLNYPINWLLLWNMAKGYIVPWSHIGLYNIAAVMNFRNKINWNFRLIIIIIIYILFWILFLPVKMVMRRA